MLELAELATSLAWAASMLACSDKDAWSMGQGYLSGNRSW